MNNLLHDEKDIDTIFFYAINGNINYLILYYTANGIKYKIDYKDINFKETVDRIIKVYNTLKNDKQIKLIGDLTEDIINGKVLFNNNIYNKTLINPNKYDYLSMISYIMLIIKHTIKAIGINSELSYHDNKFSYLNYNKVDLKKTHLFDVYTIPVIFYKTNNGYKLKYKLMNNDNEYIFDTDLNIYDKRIIVNINNTIYNGEIIFDKLNIDNTIRFKKVNSLVYLENIENNLNDLDIKVINKVFEMLDIKYEINGIKTTEFDYLLYNKNTDYEYNMHLNIHNDIIRIHLKRLKKYQKDKIDFKVEEESYDYIITKYNERYILVQQKFLFTNNSNYEYKKNINKSRYYLFESEKEIFAILDANIINKEEINIDNLDNVKKLTKIKGDL